MLEELQHRNQRQPSWRQSRLTPGWIETAEILVFVEGIELIAEAYGDGAFREGGSGNPGRLGRDVANGFRMKAHGCLRGLKGWSGIRR
jgi:hypothetical protein